MLIGFNPDGITNLVDFSDYCTFFTRTLLVFGIAFEIPLFVVMLNLAGVVSGQDARRSYRPWIIIGIFVFAAVATPSTDPFTMLILAVPMVVLFLRLRGDRPRPSTARKARNAARTPASSPDEVVAAVTDRPRRPRRPVRPARVARRAPTVTWSRRRRAAHRLRRARRRSRADGPGAARPATCSRSTRPTRRRSPPTTYACGAHQAWRHGEVLPGRRDGRLDARRARHGVHRRPGPGRLRPAGPGRRRLAGALHRPLRSATRPCAPTSRWSPTADRGLTAVGDDGGRG